MNFAVRFGAEAWRNRYLLQTGSLPLEEIYKMLMKLGKQVNT